VNSETISMIAGVALSLAFGYIPGLSTKFDELEPTLKRLCMGLCVVAVGLASIAWGCVGTNSVSCDTDTVVNSIRSIIMALMANQSMYAISPKLGSK